MASEKKKLLFSIFRLGYSLAIVSLLVFLFNLFKTGRECLSFRLISWLARGGGGMRIGAPLEL